MWWACELPGPSGQTSTALNGAQCRLDIIQDVFFSQSRDQVTGVADVQVGMS